MMAAINVDFQNCFISILLCLFSLNLYYLILKKTKNSHLVAYGCNLPPSPPSLPIIGHLHLLRSSLSHKSLQKLSSKYGSLFHLRVFNFPVVVVSSASVAYEIFKAHDLNISSRENPSVDESLLIGTSVFGSAPYGDYFKFMKKLLVTKLLGPHALERSRGIRADELEKFNTSLFDKAMKKESVEISKEASKLISSSICRMSMGRSFSEENGEAEKVRGLVTELDGLTKKVLFATLLRRPLEILGISLFKKEITCVSNSFDEVLERVLVEHEQKLDELQDRDIDMVDELLAAYRDENAEHKITRNHIKAFLVELLFAGTDTSAQSIQWTMAEVVNNPKILERLREEIDSVVGKRRLIQETDLPNLPYLQAVVKEGLRLHPPLPLFVRTFKEGCKMGGFYIPEKTTLIGNAYVMMRDPKVWEDPEEFKPERFLASSRLGQEEERREQALKYIPFGSGRRGCPGSNLGYFFIGTVIGMMVQCFDWRIKGDKVNMDEAGGLNLTMEHPLKCTPVARNEPLLSNLQMPIHAQRKLKHSLDTREEKLSSEELEDALQRAVLSHDRFVEHYKELLEKYNDLGAKHKATVEWITELKKAVAKAGKKVLVPVSLNHLLMSSQHLE